MQRVIYFALMAFVFGCASSDQKRTRALLHPSFDDFAGNIRYPYRAPLARQQQIERAAHVLHKEMSEAEVLHIMGPPDYKARWFFPPDTLRGEVWHYVHTWERPIMPAYHGKMVTITLDERTRPRTLLEFDASGCEVGRHE